MKALISVSLSQAKRLIAKAVAAKLKNTSRRVYFAHGSTNQLILSELGINIDNYYNGYISHGELKSNKLKSDIVILNNSDHDFIQTMDENDIIVKGANAISCENGKYRAAVAVASPEGGTYGNIITKAMCVGAEVIIPVSHNKLVPKLLSGQYTQSSFDITMGLPISLIEYQYGEIYTEIDAFREIFNIDAEIYLSGDINSMESAMIFVIKGAKNNIEEVYKRFSHNES